MKLGDIADVIMGQSPPGDTYNSIGNGLLLLNGPTEFGPSHPTSTTWTDVPTKICRKDDLIFCVRGSTTGRMNWADQEYCLGRGVAAIRAKAEKIDTRYVFYCLTQGLDRLLSRCSGSVFPNLSRDDFASFDIPWPEKNLRNAITAILGSLDDKIELNRRMNETLEATAQAIYKSWFVDFDPVKAKAEGRKPFGMDDETAALFPREFEASKLGKIPKGWRVARLPDIFDIDPSCVLKKGCIAPYLDMANVPTNGMRAMEVRDREFNSGSKFMNGDTLVARITPCLENGKTAFVDFLEGGQVGGGSTEFIVLRPKKPFPSEYGYILARTEDFRAFAISNMTGTSGRQRVPAACFDHFEAIVSSDEILIKYGQAISDLFRKIKRNDEESSSLKNIRNLLLPKLLSGVIKCTVDNN